MEIITVHGIFSDGSNSVDNAGRALEARGFEWDDVGTVRRNPITARWGHRKDSHAVYLASDPGDVLVAHSNGCLVSVKAAERRPEKPYKALFLFRPAMSAKYDFSKVPSETRIYCVFHEDDRAIQWGARLAFWHPFGKAGIEGFRDSRVINLRSRTSGHGADFHGRELVRWVDYIEQQLHSLL